MVTRVVAQTRAFFFQREFETWLAILRIGLGLQVALYLFSLQGSWFLLLSGAKQGFITREFAEAMLSAESPYIPRIGWLVACGRSLGLEEQKTLLIIWLLLLVAACGLVAGLRCRTAAILAWFFHLSVAKSAGLLAYGVDNFMTVGLFYLMVSPLPDHYALDAKLRHWRPAEPTLLGFSRRVIQLHLCVIYLFGGFTKALGRGWWDGTNLWRALTRPPFDVLPPEFIARFDWLLPPLGIAVCMIELAYPFLIWPRRTRRLWLILVCAMHLGIGLMMGMYLFALIMLVLNVAAFGPSAPLPADENAEDPRVDAADPAPAPRGFRLDEGGPALR